MYIYIYIYICILGSRAYRKMRFLYPPRGASLALERNSEVQPGCSRSWLQGFWVQVVGFTIYGSGSEGAQEVGTTG